MPTNVESVTVEVTLSGNEATLNANGVLSNLAPQPGTLGPLIEYPTCTEGGPVDGLVLSPGDVRRNVELTRCADTPTWLTDEGYTAEPTTAWSTESGGNATVIIANGQNCGVIWDGSAWQAIL